MNIERELRETMEREPKREKKIKGERNDGLLVVRLWLDDKVNLNNTDESQDREAEATWGWMEHREHGKGKRREKRGGSQF